MYNFDEKGFLIGLSRSTKRIVALETLKSKRMLGASQDGSREFMSREMDSGHPEKELNWSLSCSLNERMW
jgi:hypothetical protein